MEFHPSAAAAAPPPPMAIVTAGLRRPLSSLQSPRQAKMVFPKKKPLKWPTGVAPEDLVASTGDFIWNKDLLDRMQSLLRKKEQSSDFLSLNRAMSLDRSYQSICQGIVAWKLCTAEAGFGTAGGGGISDTEDVVLWESGRNGGRRSQAIGSPGKGAVFQVKMEAATPYFGICGIGVVSAYISRLSCNGSWDISSRLRLHVPGADTNACQVFTSKAATFVRAAIQDAVIIVEKLQV